MAGPSGVTPIQDLPYPVPDDTVDVPRDIQALAMALDGAMAPVGAIVMWATATAPDGWLFCQGQTVLASAYPELAAVIPPVGGNITLPDLRDRFPVGVGATALGSSGGAASVTLSGAQSGVPAHTHPNNIAVAQGGVHDHALNTQGVGVGPGSGNGYNAAMLKNSGTSVGKTNDSASHTHSLTGGVTANAAANAASSHENRPPYLCLNFIIRAQ